MQEGVMVVADRPILVVDDEQNIRDMLAEILTEEGYSVESARDGEEALHAVKRHSPSLVLLDLNMPILDGFGFVKSLAERGIGMPIILMSAATHLRKHAADLGVVAFIGKPFEILDLLKTVEQHYGRA